MRYFIIAGEASGDIHGAHLVKALIDNDPEANIRFFGGDLMAEAAGSAPDIHYKTMAYMGFSEVIRHLPDIKRNIKKAKEIIAEFNPDAIVLIDYPGFNLRIAEHAHKLGIKVYYYISPKVWAWKEHRVKKMKRDVDRIFSILPFEKEFFMRHGMEVDYVGNPSVIEIDNWIERECAPRADFLKKHGLDNKPLLALVPGSRYGEIKNNMRVMQEVAARHPEFQAVVAGAPSIDIAVYREFTSLPVIFGETFSLMRHGSAALVTSGTATLECALLDTPQVACYRGNGSRITYAIMSRWLKIPYVTLPNLIAGERVIPEMLMHHCNADEVDEMLTPLLANSDERERQINGYRLIRERLGKNDPAQTAAKAICRPTTSQE